MTKKQFCILTNQKIYLLPLLAFFLFSITTHNVLAQAPDYSQTLRNIELKKENIKGIVIHVKEIANDPNQQHNVESQRSQAISKLQEMRNMLGQAICGGRGNVEQCGIAKHHFNEAQQYITHLNAYLNNVAQSTTEARQADGQADNPAGRQADGTERGVDCEAELTPTFEGPPRPECQQQAQQVQEQQLLNILNECERKADSAWQHFCSGSLFSQAAIELVRLAQSNQHNGDQKKICEDQKKLRQFAVLINGGALYACMHSLSQCVGACKDAAQQLSNTNDGYNSQYYKDRAEDIASECSNKRMTYGILGGIQLTHNTLALKSAQKCVDQTTDNPPCEGGTIKNGICVPDAPDTNPTCDGLSGRALAECQSIPRTAPRGTRIAATPMEFTNSNKRNSLPKIRDPQFDPDDHLKGLGSEGEDQLIQAGKYTGNGDLPASSSSLLGGSSPGGGGGFGGGFPGGGTAAAPEEEGEEPFEENLGPGIDTDILGDVIGSRAGISSLGGGSGSRPGGIGRFAEKFKNFKFPKLFDKKGKNKTNRSPAGTGKPNTITAANGLSNFQKVSRAMNKKRETTLR